MADEVLEAAAAPAAGLTQVERVVDTFVAPLKTFEDVQRSASWWLPFVLSIVAGYVLAFSVQQKVGWSQLADNMVLSNPSAQSRLADATPEQVALQHKITMYAAEGGFYASPVVNLLSLLVVGVVLWMTINFAFGGKAQFGEVFAVLTYAFLPAVVKALVAAVVLWVGASAENFTPQNMLGTSVGYYIETPGALKTFLTSVDLFTIWTAVLLSLGLAVVAKTKRSAGFLAVFGWWLLLVLVGTAVAAVTS